MASTLTRTHSRPNSKPEYKDYVNFLDSYKCGKKDNESIDSGVSVKSYSLTNSNNTSNSSLNFDQTDNSKSSCTSFSNYLENYQNKKFVPIKPKFGGEEPAQNKKPLMKSEVFIEVSSPKPEMIVKTIPVNNTQASQMKIGNKVFANKPPVVEKAQVFQKVNQNNHQMSTHNKRSESVNSSTALKNTLAKFENSNNQEHKLIQKVQIPVALKKMEKPEISNNQEHKPIQKVQIPVALKKMEKPEISNNKPMPKYQAPPPVSPVPNSNSENITPKLKTELAIPPPPPMIDLLLTKPPTKLPISPLKSNTLPRKQNKPLNQMNSNKTSPITFKNNQNEGTKLDKNDPRVRKLVYGTLRGMYGAYHEKANDFVATLPRNMVRKDNGIQNIINVIASNGDLEKLNGRINPNPEQE